MKIQIDTTNKTIKLETSENLGEFMKALEQMLPNCLWKEFKLETNTTINWGTPIIWKTYPDYPCTPYPYTPYRPWITYTTGNNYTLCSGTYSVEV